MSEKGVGESRDDDFEARKIQEVLFPLRAALHKELKRSPSMEELAEEWNNSIVADESSEYFGKKAEAKHGGREAWLEIDGLDVGHEISIEIV